MLRLDVVLDGANEADFLDETALRRVALGALAHLKEDGAYELGVAYVDEQTSQSLNAQYRQKNKPTNVLSFSSGLLDDCPMPATPLGDLVICAPVVRREAAAQQKTLVDHLTHLVVHGVLHLLGFDHENDDDAARMEGLETRILAAWGIKDPYQIDNPSDPKAAL